MYGRMNATCLGPPTASLRGQGHCLKFVRTQQFTLIIYRKKSITTNLQPIQLYGYSVTLQPEISLSYSVTTFRKWLGFCWTVLMLYISQDTVDLLSSHWLYKNKKLQTAQNLTQARIIILTLEDYFKIHTYRRLPSVLIESGDYM